MQRLGNWTRFDLPWGRSLDLALPDTFDAVAHKVRTEGTYFPPHYEIALAITPPDGVVLDVGAHIGTFSLAAAATGRRVIAVEASPRNIDLLEHSARANHLDPWISLVPVAVANRSGTVRFRQEGAWGRIASSGGHDIVEVPVRTGAEILTELCVPRVDLVKMDIEGSEIAAVEGMAVLFSTAAAPVLVYESNGHTLRMFDATPEDLVGAIAALGYESYLVGDRELTPVTVESFQPETTVDYLAVKGALNLPHGWRIGRARNETQLARAAINESRSAFVDHRAQIGRSLERAPASLLARRDVQLALSALALDPDDRVARAASWSVAARGASARIRRWTASRDSAAFHALAEQGRALRNTLQQIRTRWGTRP
jgi:FkbM family methyltransferase